jgi:hypothetical protein
MVSIRHTFLLILGNHPPLAGYAVLAFCKPGEPYGLNP